MRKSFVTSSWLAVSASLWLSCSAQDASVTIKVIAPKSTPKESRICVAGNQNELGDWNPGKVELQREDDSTWVRTFRARIGVPLEFKITRGTWNSQAIFLEGAIPPNMKLTVRGDSVLIVRPKSWSDAGMKTAGGIVGTVQYHRGLKGDGLQYDRDLIVWLPPSYNREVKKRYPVLYMHDGQNVFDPSTSFIGYDWHVDEIADTLIRSGKMQEIIVVGIYNSPDRIPEYSDTELGRKYAEFVVRKVKPLVDSTYRTLPDREHTAVMGSSMGGLISFLFVWWHPDVFSSAGCMSSVYGRGRTSILADVEDYEGPKKPIRVFMDCGGAGGDETLKPGMEEMAAILKRKGYIEGTDFQKYFYEKDEHNERAWAARIWRPLLFMFGK